MNRNTTIIIGYVLILCYALFACKKQEQETLTPKITVDKVETTATSATFTWTVDWPGKLISVVEVSKNEDMSNSQFYGSEDETENHNFTVTVTDLEEATKYYYRYVVWNHFYVDNKFVMETKSFITETDMAVVKTLEVTDVTRTSATGQGEIISDGGLEITERGICWSTSHNPTTSDSHAASGQNTSVYSTLIENLNPGETYYVKAYAKNHNGCSYGDEVMFFTESDKPVVTTTQPTSSSQSTAICGGNVIKDCGAAVTERGICWSTEHNPTIDENHANCGQGLGSFSVNLTGLSEETIYYCKAYAINEVGISYGDEMQFTTLPEGAAGGYYTLDDSGKKVLFSKGNLQYRANDGKWRFAEHQYDCIGGDNNNISSTYNGYIDLFGWGTSGWDNGNTYFHPWDWDVSDGTLYGPHGNYGLIGDYANSDWGVNNTINNGGNQAGLWRTLSSDEWKFILYYRNASTLNGIPNARYMPSFVNGVWGLVLFPDIYTHPIGVALPDDYLINDELCYSYWGVDYDIASWKKMEEAGAVFLPEPGARLYYEDTGLLINSYGGYWSTSCSGVDKAIGFMFGGPSFGCHATSRSDGLGVRLVRDVE